MEHAKQLSSQSTQKPNVAADGSDSFDLLLKITPELKNSHRDLLNELQIIEKQLKVHWCRFETPPRCSCSYENNTLKILHS